MLWDFDEPLILPKGAKYQIENGMKVYVDDNGKPQVRKRGGPGWTFLGTLYQPDLTNEKKYVSIEIPNVTVKEE